MALRLNQDATIFIFLGLVMGAPNRDYAAVEGTGGCDQPLSSSTEVRKWWEFSLDSLYFRYS